MAKKKAKKSAPKKSGGRKKPSAPRAARSPGGASASGVAMKPGVHQIDTGKGPGPAQIGADLVARFNSGNADSVGPKWHAKDMVSIEGMGQAFSGEKAIDEKNQGWYAQNEILGGSAEGPFVGATGFAVRFRIHTKDKQSGKEATMDEVGVYTVRDGKIVREEFMYGG